MFIKGIATPDDWVRSANHALSNSMITPSASFYEEAKRILGSRGLNIEQFVDEPIHRDLTITELVKLKQLVGQYASGPI